LFCRQARDQRAMAPAGGHERAAPTTADRDAAAAQSFYGDALRGRQVWPTDCTAAEMGLWFLVGGTLIDVRAALDAGRPPIALAVDEPEELAARCWDAGFDVRVHDDASGRGVLSVIDPFGREIVLVCRESGRPACEKPTPARRRACEKP